MLKDRFIGKWAFPLDDSLLEQSARRGEQYNFERIGEDIKKKVPFRSSDVVLDLCCGNAAITRLIAPVCREIHGVDFSAELMGTAKRVKEREKLNNLSLHLADAMSIDKLFPANTFDKSYCYFSFQYFDMERRKALLKKLSKVTRPGGLIFLGDIPDKTRKWGFYGSKMKFYRERLSRLIQGKEGECDLGWWIDPQEILDWGKKRNFQVSILPQEKSLPHAHYRFDVLIKTENRF